MFYFQKSPRPDIRGQKSDVLSSPRLFAWGLVLIIILGAFIRFPSLFANTFATDEALFAMWARYIAVWRDPFLFDVPTPVDKPPLLFYLQALFYPLQGPVEWAARLPNFLASIMLIPLVGRMAFQLTNRNVQRALLAAGIVTLSPLAIQFSATAYTDPLLTFMVTVALWCAIRPEPAHKQHPLLTSSALWLGIAFWAKYQAILFLPLVWLFEWGHHLPALVDRRDRRDRRGINPTATNNGLRPEVVRWVARFGGCLAALLVWDLASGRGIDLFSRQVSSYGGVALTPLDELLPRLWEWFKLFLYVPGVAVLAAVLLLTKAKGDEFKITRVYLAGFVCFFVLFHWIVNIQAWDRYYLPLVPVFSLWVALLPSRINVQTGRPHLAKQRGLVALLCAAFILQAIPARVGWYPIGGQPSSDEGAAAIAQTILDEPYGTVLYDHWYSWHWRYHFFYKGVYVEWFGPVEDLIDNLDAFYDQADVNKRYLALRGGDRLTAEIETALTTEGYRLELVAHEGRIELYVITRKQ